MEIGKIVKANSHIDLVAQVYGPGEVPQPPTAADYSFGTFVLVEGATGGAGSLVAAVYGTQLLNPEFGRLGPRLSPPVDVGVFAPDYLNEKAVLLGLVVLGEQRPEGYRQGVPGPAAAANAPVRQIEEAEFLAFHSNGGTVALHYARLLQAQGNPLLLELLLQTVGRLEPHFSDQALALRTLRTNLMWQSRVEVNR